MRRPALLPTAPWRTRCSLAGACRRSIPGIGGRTIPQLVLLWVVAVGLVLAVPLFRAAGGLFLWFGSIGFASTGAAAAFVCVALLVVEA